MAITLIIGDSDQGKSTLVRCLTGKSRDKQSHPHQKNIVSLDWVLANPPTQTHETLVLISSLNEGGRNNNTRNTTVAIQPAGLQGILHSYGRLQNPPTRAILCISSSVRTPGWTLADYHNVMTAPVFAGRYPVTNVVHVGQVTIGHALIWPNPTVPGQRLAPIIVPGPLVAANSVAQAARPQIGLV
jgi:energy-coupling factor transporter ATP-binding protein EcfA2